MENEENTQNEQEEQTAETKCVFVSGIPYTTTEEEIKELFSKCGDIKELKLPKYQDTGRNIGYAHIYFNKNKSVKKALELEGTYIGARYINVKPAKGENKERFQRKADEGTPDADCRTVIVKNLPYDITEDDIGDKFRPCGNIKSIRLVYNSKFQHFKGFGYIEFEEYSGVINALKLHGKPIKGRAMVVDYEETGPKMGYKYRSDAPSKFNKEYKEIVKKSLQKKRKRGDQ